MNLREQIKSANSEAEIINLLSTGNKFTYASDKTKRSWKSTAKFRLSQLSSGDVTPIADKTVVSKKTNKKKK